jgi:quercetin dioxygenase-like cupin family protein
MTMSKMKLKLVSAGILVAVAFGAVALRVALATPLRGVTPTVLAGPVMLDEIDIKSNTDDHKLKIQTRGEWVSRVVHYRVVPGGEFGWHSHPGANFVAVTAGTLTKYEAGNPTPFVYPQGTGFVEDADQVHFAANEGNTDLEVVVFLLTRAGEAPRTDEPQP